MKDAPYSSPRARDVRAAAPGVSAERAGASTGHGVPGFGWMPTRAMKQAAMAFLRVRAGAEALAIRLSGLRATDAAIAQAAARAIEWNVLVPKDTVTVEVKNGYVVLTGKVRWAFQIEEPEGCVRTLAEVRGVTNRITSADRVNPALVSPDHENARPVGEVAPESKPGRSVATARVREAPQRVRAPGRYRIRRRFGGPQGPCWTSPVNHGL